MKNVTIDLWSDVVCPWCYIGERRLERALALRPELQVERRWIPFQLRPDVPEEGISWPDFVREKFGGWPQAKMAFAQVSRAGVEEGIDFRFDRVASAPNTRDAHRLILHAAERGREWLMADALFRGYLTEGLNLKDPDHLVTMAADVGLDADEIRAFLAGRSGTQGVWESQRTAAGLGIGGVPFYVIDGRYAVSGGQPAEVWLRTLDAVGAERAS